MYNFFKGNPERIKRFAYIPDPQPIDIVGYAFLEEGYAYEH